MTKPVSISKKPRKQHTPEFRNEALKLAERIGVAATARELDELPEFNIKTIAASLRRQGLRAKASRKFSPVSYRAHGLPVLENLLEQDFSASGPNQKWAGDITYLRTDEGWLYLAVVIDLWSRAVIGWSISPRMTAHWPVMHCKWRCGGEDARKASLFIRTVVVNTVQGIIRRC